MARSDVEGLGLQIERYITPLHETLSEEGKKKLEDILTFGDTLKEKGAEARKKFWSKYDRDQFLLQLRHADKKKEELIKENHQKLEEIGFFTRGRKKQEKFITEYLKDISRYGEITKEEYDRDLISREELKKSGFREGVTLDLRYNEIGDEGAKAISEMELKKGVCLDLGGNEIGPKGAKALSEMELKEGVTLDLGGNEIGAEGAKALSKMELKEGVTLELGNNEIGAEGAEALSEIELKEGVALNLGWNKIGDEGAKAISKMELKEGVTLDLRDNQIGAEGRGILENWVADAKARGINCKVEF